MARLESEAKKRWKEALNRETSPWIACALDASVEHLSDRMSGMTGLIDWRVHGQVSRLLARGALPVDEFCLVPLPSGRQNFLVYHFKENPEPKAFLEGLRKLGIRQLSLAESTFPKDFLPKLKQNLDREGIRFSKLEPEL